MNKLLVIAVLLFSYPLFAQPEVARVELIDGKKYYMHKVETGHTLWGLQKLYDVPVEEIIAANPSVKDGLKVGQEIKIPVKEAPKPERTISDYTVKKSETLYGLSKKFDTTVDDLISLNPGAENGIKKGQVIKVPGVLSEEDTKEELTEEIVIVEEVPNPFVQQSDVNEPLKEEVRVTFSDSTIKHTVLPHETMYSISKRFMVSMDELMKANNLSTTTLKQGQVLIIPVKNERIETVPIRNISTASEINDTARISFEKKNTYNIAILMPFYLDYGDGYSASISEYAVEFYMGASIALDSLEKLGLKANVHILDTRNDSATVDKLLKDPSFKKMDLVIGPLIGQNMRQVASFCKEHKIRMICPSAVDSDLLKGNQLVYATVPSNISLMRGMASYLLQNNKNDNIVLIKPLKEKDLPLYEAFRAAFNDPSYKGVRPKLIESTMDNFSTFITRGVNTLFIVPVTDKASALKFMNALNKVAFKSKAENLFVYGTREWMNYDDINNNYKNKYNFHYASPNFMDYFSTNIIEMNRVYRKKYNADLTKWAVQGYDITMYFCAEMLLNKKVKLLMNDFNFNQVNKTDGYENTHVYIIKQEDFDLIKAGEINK